MKKSYGPGMKSAGMREGNTTPGSAPRGYPKLGRFNPGPQQAVGESSTIENYTRQLPAQR